MKGTGISFMSVIYICFLQVILSAATFYVQSTVTKYFHASLVKSPLSNLLSLLPRTINFEQKINNLCSHLHIKNCLALLENEAFGSSQSWKAETTFQYCWRVNNCFKLVWTETTYPCNSLIGYSLKWRCCSLDWPNSLWQNPVLTTLLYLNHLWGYGLSTLLIVYRIIVLYLYILSPNTISWSKCNVYTGR